MFVVSKLETDRHMRDKLNSVKHNLFSSDTVLIRKSNRKMQCKIENRLGTINPNINFKNN